MPSEVALTLYENNDEKLNLTVSSNVVGFSLVGKDMEAYVKAAASTPDNDAGVWVGTTDDGDIVVEDEDNAYVMIPAAALTTTKAWYRVDILSGGLRKTAVYGVLTVVDL